VRLLDLYCGEGGAGIGYHRAGYEVVGVDHDPRRRRYYPYEFHAADAIGYLLAHGGEYDVIHASPPCQRYSRGTNNRDTTGYSDLLGPTRTALVKVGVPWVIENVQQAPLHDPVVLCGTMFGLAAYDQDLHTVLQLLRHRGFESPLPLRVPRRCSHRAKATYAGVYHGGRNHTDGDTDYLRRGYVPKRKIQERLMGLDWHGTTPGLQQAIPPAYTAWLGQIIGQHLGAESSPSEPDADSRDP
jgi:DNA (cytosine-5)-methyltransferase 1